jgi:hypothetical protein
MRPLVGSLALPLPLLLLLLLAISEQQPATVSGAAAGTVDDSSPPPPVVVVRADVRHELGLRAAWEAAPPERRAEGLSLAVAPPPGVQGEPVAVRLSPAPDDELTGQQYSYAAGLRPENWVGTSRAPVISQPHWLPASELPPAYDAREAYPACSAMRAIQNQGGCSGCYSFATVGSLGDRLCQASNGSVNAILSAEDPLFCPNLGGCRGGNLGPVWDYLANVGVPSGCSPGQNLQPSGSDGTNSGTQPQSAASWAEQAAATPGGCCYPVARRTMETNNPTCLQEPCPGGVCPVKALGGDPGLGECVDFWGNKTTNKTLQWRCARCARLIRLFSRADFFSIPSNPEPHNTRSCHRVLRNSPHILCHIDRVFERAGTIARGRIPPRVSATPASSCVQSSPMVPSRQLSGSARAITSRQMPAALCIKAA